MTAYFADLDWDDSIIVCAESLEKAVELIEKQSDYVYEDLKSKVTPLQPNKIYTFRNNGLTSDS
jgi:hypothetical protein